MGCEESEGGVWHVGDFGVGGVLHSREVAGPVQFEKALGTVLIGAGEEDAPGPGPACLNERKQRYINTGPGEVYGLFDGEAEIALFFNEEVVVGGSNIDSASLDGGFVVGFGEVPAAQTQEGIRDLEAGLAQAMKAQDEREIWVVRQL